MRSWLLDFLDELTRDLRGERDGPAERCAAEREHRVRSAARTMLALLRGWREIEHGAAGLEQIGSDSMDLAFDTRFIPVPEVVESDFPDSATSIELGGQSGACRLRCRVPDSGWRVAGSRVR
jgi:hypothetical protein